jgi:hypothetical protein
MPVVRTNQTDTVHATGSDTTAPASNLVISTPASWQTVDIEMLMNSSAVRQMIESSLDGIVPHGREFAEGVERALRSAEGCHIFFAAVGLPNEVEPDMSSLTLTVGSPTRRVAPSGAGVGAAADSGAATGEAGDEEREDAPRSGAAEVLVSLPAGPAMCVASLDELQLDANHGPLRVLCVEYALQIPGTDNVLVMAFTTVAPSDIERAMSRCQLIASTLVLA